MRSRVLRFRGCMWSVWFDDFSTDSTSAPQRSAKQEALDDTLGCVVGIGAGAAALFWVAYTFLYAPSHPDPEGQPAIPYSSPGAPTAVSPETAVQTALWTYLPSADPRLELMKGNNLDIYVSRSSFEDVAFPDRPSVIENVGKAWCGRVTHVFMPTVQLRDVKSGKVMASYSCVLGRASVEEP